MNNTNLGPCVHKETRRGAAIGYKKRRLGVKPVTSAACTYCLCRFPSMNRVVCACELYRQKGCGILYQHIPVDAVRGGGECILVGWRGEGEHCLAHVVDVARVAIVSLSLATSVGGATVMMRLAS